MSGSDQSGLFYSLSFPKYKEIVLRLQMGCFYKHCTLLASLKRVDYIFVLLLYCRLAMFVECLTYFSIHDIFNFFDIFFVYI